MTTVPPHEPIPPIPVENPEDPSAPEPEPDEQVIEASEGLRDHDDHPVDTEIPD